LIELTQCQCGCDGHRGRAYRHGRRHHGHHGHGRGHARNDQRHHHGALYVVSWWSKNNQGSGVCIPLRGRSSRGFWAPAVKFRISTCPLFMPASIPFRIASSSLLRPRNALLHSLSHPSSQKIARTGISPATTSTSGGAGSVLSGSLGGGGGVALSSALDRLVDDLGRRLGLPVRVELQVVAFGFSVSAGVLCIWRLDQWLGELAARGIGVRRCIPRSS
jgi:hypothetical protein